VQSYSPADKCYVVRAACGSIQPDGLVDEEPGTVTCLDCLARGDHPQTASEAIDLATQDILAAAKMERRKP
jgi:hypothetical protein